MISTTTIGYGVIGLSLFFGGIVATVFLIKMRKGSPELAGAATYNIPAAGYVPPANPVPPSPQTFNTPPGVPTWR